MATGYIGKSTATATTTSSQQVQTGTTLSYTCPASGVQYSILSITAAYSLSLDSTTSGRATVLSGPYNVSIKYFSSSSSGDRSHDSITYNVILRPGQVWSETASVTVTYGTASASIEASVIEVV